MCAPYKKRGDNSNRVCGIEEKKAAKECCWNWEKETAIERAARARERAVVFEIND